LPGILYLHSNRPVGLAATGLARFHTVFGLAWFAGSALLGIMYDHSTLGVAVLSLVLQLLALPVLRAFISKWRAR